MKEETIENPRKTPRVFPFPKNKISLCNEVFSSEFCNQNMYRKLSHAFQGKHFSKGNHSYMAHLIKDKRKQRLQLFSLHILYYCAYPGL